jgi:hypothetical protein
MIQSMFHQPHAIIPLQERNSDVTLEMKLMLDGTSE